MPYTQGAIVIATDPFGNSPTRPYLICSNNRLPFHGEEYVAAGITTTERDDAIELTDDCFTDGRLPRTSYISPWTVITLKDWMISKQPAAATLETVDDAVDELSVYLET